MRTSSFLGIHEDGSSFRSVHLRRRDRFRYRIACSDLGFSAAEPGVPWGTVLPANGLSIKMAPLSEGADSWRERELQDIEVRREPQGKGFSLSVVVVSAQRKEVNHLIQPAEDGGAPARVDAEPLALWAARQALAEVPGEPFFLLHGLSGRWILLYTSDGVLRFAGHLSSPGETSPLNEAMNVNRELGRISHAMGSGEGLLEIPIELSGTSEEQLGNLEEVLKAEGWNHVRRLRPSKKFRRRFKGGSDFPMAHLIALGIALRGLEAAEGRPLLNFCETPDLPAGAPRRNSLRLAVGLLSLCVLVFAFSMERSVRSLQREVTRLKSDLSRYAKILEPSASGSVPSKRVAARVAKFQDEMRRLRAARYPSVTAVELLAALSEAFSDAKSFELKEVFQDGESILLRGSLATLESVTLFQESLRKLSPIRSVTLLSARSKRNRVEARFRLLGPPWHGSKRSP